MKVLLIIARRPWKLQLPPLFTAPLLFQVLIQKHKLLRLTLIKEKLYKSPL